jgi:hypothetical protein
MKYFGVFPTSHTYKILKQAGLKNFQLQLKTI